ncbi:MAG: Lipid A biosynthesis lauroyl acyltransferase (EC [uncultured Sulfurovum sp.]|uniref:Lipid A biosynthesis lauroyl acyltransferase (EC) n=1 Tax=uncultured Sulfurovum sp. TaxID=269237 RepID=A0A6S6T2L1_9BACT|nr:MAG: Lipid A biosynthesis lauroyl acyltransferase (EC [uncultured Sulfurovum sp.]
MIDYLYLGLYKTFGFILTVLPRKLTIKLMHVLAWCAFSISKKHQRIINANLDLAFDKKYSNKEKKQIGIQAFVNLIDTTFGIIHRDKMDKNQVIKNVSFKNEEIIQQYQKENRQFILVTGHYGNWELLSQSIAIYFDLNLVGVGRELDSKLMDKVLIKNRERFNVEMVYKKGAMKGCIRAIGQKKTVGILTDQHLAESQSIDVNFFQHKVTHTPLASILSRKFNLDLIPAYISTDDYKSYLVTIHPPIKSVKTLNQEEDLNNMTIHQAQVLEKVIRERPEQWFWQHKRWKAFYKEIYT